ncbi:hypothetical protein ACIVBQ_000446 [Tenacibaculum discolor]
MSAVDLSYNVVCRFNLTEQEVAKLVDRLTADFLTKENSMPSSMTEEEKFKYECEKYFKSKMFKIS